MVFCWFYVLFQMRIYSNKTDKKWREYQWNTRDDFFTSVFQTSIDPMPVAPLDYVTRA